MKDSADLRCLLLLQDPEGVVVGLPCVDHDGPALLAGEADLGPEGLPLLLGRRVIVMVVQPDLSDGEESRVGGQILEVAPGAIVPLLRVVGMDSRCEEKVRVLLGEFPRGVRIADQRSDAEQMAHPGLSGPAEDFVAILVERRESQMGVRIGEDHLHRTVAPTWTGSSTPSHTTLLRSAGVRSTIRCQAVANACGSDTPSSTSRAWST